MSATTDNPPTTRKPRRIWRWIGRTLVLAAALIVAVAVCLQILLWTDIPRKLIVDKLQTVLGVRVQAPVIHISWSGHTTLERVQISLPLAGQSFLDVPRLDVTHTSLPMILLTQDLRIDELLVHQPTMRVAQNTSGQWNVAQAINVVTRAGGATPAQHAPAKPVLLPAVVVEDATLQLLDRAGRSSTIPHVNVRGMPGGPLVWKYDAQVEHRLKLTGQISPGGIWEHEVAFATEDLTPLLATWAKQVPDLRFAGTWHGRIDGPNVDGRIDFQQLSVGTISVQGPANVQRQASGEVTITPNALVVQTSNPLDPKVTLTSGALVLGPTSASAKDLAVSLNGGDAKINGTYSWENHSAVLNAMWRDIAVSPSLTTDGSVNGKLSMPWPGAPRIEAEVTSSGRTSVRSWDSHLTLTGVGRNWNDIDWVADVSRFAWTGRQNFVLSDLKATVFSRADKLTLQSISVANRDWTGHGEYQIADRSWWMALDGGDLTVKKLDNAPLGFRLRASGKDGRAAIDELTLNSGEVEVRATGYYDDKQPKPVSLNVDLSHLPDLEGADPNSPVRGRLNAKASLSGTLNPLALRIDQGTLYGSNVCIGNRTVGQLAIEVEGSITEGEAQFETTEATILGGKWRVRGEWPSIDGGSDFRIAVRQLSLADVADLLQQRDISGSMDGVWFIHVPANDRMRIKASGSADLRDVTVGKLQVQKISAQSSLDAGRLVLDPVRLEQGSGSADLHVDLALQQPKRMNVTAHVSQWPATAPSGDATATISGHSELAVDLAKQSATGPMNAQLAFTIKDQDAGTLSIDSTMEGRTIRVSRIEAAALGGTASGAGVFSIDQPMQTTGDLRWENLDSSQMVSYLPSLQGTGGKISGSAKIAPSTDPRAVGPLKLTAEINSDELHYKAIQLGNGQLTSYFTRRGFVLDESTVHAAGGYVRLWARAASHEGGIRSSQFQIEFGELDLDEINRALDSNAKPMPGRLAGSFVLIGTVRDPDTLYGQGSVKVTKSNLVNFGPIRGLYDVMHIGQASTDTDGAGRFDVRLDNNTLSIENARYFNRGLQVRARAALKRIWKAPDSPLDSTVIGFLRPLRDVKLPFFDDADQIMNAIQQSVTTVKVTGTARQYKVVPITFSEAGETMRKIVIGEAQDK